MQQAGVVYSSDNHSFFEHKLHSLALAGFQQWRTYLLVKFSFPSMVTPFIFFSLRVESTVEWEKNSKTKVETKVVFCRQ